MGAALDAFAKMVPWHPERRLRVRYADRVSWQRGESLSPFVTPRAECRSREYRGLVLCCFEDPIDGFYLVKDEDVWRRELEFEGRKRHHVWCPRFV